MVEDYYITPDKQKIFWRFSPLDNSPICILIVHGLGEHSGRYGNFFDRFSRSYSICAMDLRGHGRSGGQRGHISSFYEYFSDVRYFIGFIRNSLKINKIIIIGHSMGGLIAVRCAQEYGREIEGLIVSSPLLRIKVPVPRAKAFIGRLVSSVIPRLSMSNGLDPSFLSHDSTVVEAYVADPLVHTRVTARWFTEVLMAMEQANDKASTLTLPSLFLHAGDDRLTDIEGTKSLFERIPPGNKELKIYQGFYHELFNETGKEQVFSDVERWLRLHTS